MTDAEKTQRTKRVEKLLIIIFSTKFYITKNFKFFQKPKLHFVSNSHEIRTQTPRFFAKLGKARFQN